MLSLVEVIYSDQYDESVIEARLSVRQSILKEAGVRARDAMPKVNDEQWRLANIVLASRLQ